MAKQIIDIGVQGNDGTGDSIRESFRKVNENFDQLYAVVGASGTIKFENLDDGSTYDQNQIIMATPEGDTLSARDIIGGSGITVDLSDPLKLTINADVANLAGDLFPQIGAAFNANNLAIGRVPNPSQALVDAFNSLWQSKGYTTTINELALNVGYANANYVRLTTDRIVGTEINGLVVPGPLRLRDEPYSAQSGVVGYDATLTGNYLSNEAVPRKNVVLRTGDSMTGELLLNDHPIPMTGAGTPNGVADLQAATKFYVDNSTFSSNVNLYVSATSGDNLQTKTPVGKEGRFWQYAYKTISQAAQQAESLITLASQEPGPYRQRITYTSGVDQVYSTIQSVTLINGNTGKVGHVAAYDLLQANRAFIQSETIAYINKKYVNSFSYDAGKCSRDVKLILDGIGYDLVLNTTYNTKRAANGYFNSISSKVLSDQLIQTVDAIKFARDQIINFSYSTAYLDTYIQDVIDAICYDLVFQTNYQSMQVALAFSSAQTDLSNEQIADLLSLNPYAVSEGHGSGSIMTLVLSSALTNAYPVGSSILVAGMTPSSLNGVKIVTASTTASVSFASNVIGASTVNGTVDRYNLLNTILEISQVKITPTAVSFIKTLATTITNIVLYNKMPTVAFPNLASTPIGKENAKILLLENVKFIQAEIISYLTASFPDVSFNKSTCKRDIEFIIRGLIYDFMYSGNSQSVYAGRRYWIFSTLQIADFELSATLAAIARINTLVQAVIVNGSIPTIYQQTINQYRNDTLTGGSTVSLSISTNLATIADIIENNTSPTVVLPDYTGGVLTLRNVKDAIVADTTDLIATLPSYINYYFPVINNSVITGTITDLFGIIIDSLELGFGTIGLPTYVSKAGTAPGITHAREAILANLEFIAEESVAYIAANISTYPGLVYNANSCKRDIKYILAGVCYDLTYGGNAASFDVANAYRSASDNQLILNISSNELAATIDAIGHAQSVAQDVARNQVVTPVYSSASQTRNSLWADGTAATATLDTLFNLIKDIVENGEPTDDPVTALIYPTTIGYDSDDIAARNIIVTNKNKIAADTITFINTTFKGGFNYDESICKRDVGLIIDAMSIDLLTSYTDVNPTNSLMANYQTVNAGKSYFKNASAKSVAIGSQYSETVDGINFAKELSIQVLNLSTRTRYQTAILQQTTLSAQYTLLTLPSALINVTGGTLTPVASASAISEFTNNMNTLLSIIAQGYGSAPAVSYGSGIWNIAISNGGIAVDQGSETNNDIIPAKVLVGVSSAAYATIVKYLRGSGAGVDTIQVRSSKPGFFAVGEQIEFGETVKDLNITIFVESGIYYEDLPIRLPANCSIKGDDFRRAIIRPRDRISQSPWVTLFFYRDAIIDALEIGLINYTGTNYATSVGISLGAASSGDVAITLDSGQAPSSWIGKVLVDNYLTFGNAKRGKAIVNSVSGNILNCSIIYPFTSTTYSSGSWFLYTTTNYGRHYLTNPLDVTSTPKNNKDIDVFLCNDATRITDVTFQGHGGFAMVLDPAGQIKTKSPYGQVCSSFSQSNNQKRFAGGQFADGFAGRVFGTIIAINDYGITITVTGGANSGLDVRPPQPPCAFYVQGYRYQINDVVSWSQTIDPGTGAVTGGTAVLTLDTATPYLYTTAGLLSYNDTKCARDVGLILDAVGFDIVLGSNFQSIKAGLSYLRSYSSVVTANQKVLTIAGINKAKDLALATISNSTAQSRLIANMAIIANIIDQGLTGLSAITFPNPVGVSDTDDIAKARTIIQANRTFIQNEISAYIASNFVIKSIPFYNSVTCQRDVGYIVDAMTYDMFYGGVAQASNSQIKDTAEAYYRLTASYIVGEETYHVAAFTRLKYILPFIVQGSTGWTKSTGNYETQITTLAPTAYSTYATSLARLCDILIDYVADGDYDTTTTTVNPVISGQPAALIADRSSIQTSKTTIQNSVISFLNTGGGLAINIEMGGNKSMLANDFAMINDLGYAIVCTNGAVSEQVSTFSYYCWTHYWSNNGGQIRSVGGSNSHGHFGLRSSGYDVTEQPDQVKLSHNLVQTMHVYKQGTTINEMVPTSAIRALSIWVYNYEYIPTNTSEVEIDHSVNGGENTRYQVSSIEHTSISFNGQNVLRLNLSTAGSNGTSSTGLTTALYDGQIIAVRALQNFKFTDIANVKPTRPSTALQFADNLSDVYRVIAYNLTLSTGETLPANASVLQIDTSYSYYKFFVDPLHVSTVDPNDVSKTQGSKIGDTKIAVEPVEVKSTIDQINKGTYIGTWHGRTHRVIRYVAAKTIATGTYVSWTSATSTLIISNLSPRLLVAGDIISGIGFTTQTVVSSTYSEVTQYTTVIVSTSVGVGTPSGTISFGVSANAYLVIDQTPIANNSADGTVVNALTFKSSVAQIGNSTSRIITFDVPYSKDAQLPAVDSFITIANNGFVNYNKPVQVVAVLNTTKITVATTIGLNPGMIISSVTSGSYFAAGTYTIIQSVDSNTQFTVSPACWIPSGATVSATAASVLASITKIDTGLGYIAAPIITIIGGGASSNAVATCTITALGAIDVITIVDPGFGYTSTPDILIQDIYRTRTASLAAVLTTSPTVTVTASAGESTTTLSALYSTDPGVLGSISATTNATATMLTSGITGTTLTVGTVSAGTVAVGMYLTGGTIPAGTYIVANLTGTGTSAGSTWTVSQTVSQSSTTLTGTNNLITINTTTGLSVGNQIIFTLPTSTGATFGGITIGTTYYITEVCSAVNGISVSTALGGSNLTVSTASGTLISYVTRFSFGTSITASSFTNKIIYKAGKTGAFVISGVAITGTAGQFSCTATSTTLVVGQTVTISGNLTGGGSISTYANPTMYYIMTTNGSTTFTLTATLGGVTGITTTAGTTTGWTFTAGPASDTVTNFEPYLATFAFSTTTAPTVGAYYKVAAGSTNPLYNGTWVCFASTATSITLVYPGNPGTWASATTTFTKETTNSSASTLGISRAFSTTIGYTLRFGYQGGVTAQVTTRISTCRATSHDFLDIGTGSYSTTNYPYQIYGNPAIAATQPYEVKEDGVGRCFYVSTDQNGIFRVGRFFTVDQGTGTVTFSASIALSNLDGLGFKRGVVVSEFSTDSTMTNNSSDTVPVQSAIRAYIDKRLGLDHGGTPIALSALVGPGFLALNGITTMKAALNLGNNAINNVSTSGVTLPIDAGIVDPLSAANKAFVIQQVASHENLSQATDVLISSASASQMLVYNGSTSKWNNATLTGNVTISYNGTALVSALADNTITDAKISSTAAINQTKLALANSVASVSSVSITNIARTIAGRVTLTFVTVSPAPFSATTQITVAGVVPSGFNGTYTVISCNTTSVTYDSTVLSVVVTTAVTGVTVTPLNGVSTFNNSQFTVSNGFVGIAANGVALGKLQTISSNSVIGNSGNSAATPIEVTFGAIVSGGDGIKNSAFASSGVMLVSYDGSNSANNTYSVTGVTTVGAANKIVKTGTLGEINMAQLSVNSYKTISTTTVAPLTTTFTTPAGFDYLTATGSTGSNTTITTYGTFDTSNGTLKATTITTGAPATGGTITGQYAVQADSQLDVSLGTLKSRTLTTGAVATTGTITGAWSLAASSSFDITASGTSFKTTSLNAGAAATAGTITGQWAFAASSQLDLNTNSVTLKAYNITTNGTDTGTGTIQGNWSLTGASKLQATYADLAEYYEGDKEYDPGTVLVFGGDKEVTSSATTNDTRLAGVVTTNPAYVMNSEQRGIKVCIALAGRTPCKVIGRVKKGDLLTTSNTPGFAIKALNPVLGAIIGKALENKDYGEAGVIEIAVGRA